MVLHLWAQGLEEGDEHLPMLSCGAWLTLPLPFTLSTDYMEYTDNVQKMSWKEKIT